MEYLTDLNPFKSCHGRSLGRIGLFGGTFNPVHCGHIYMAKCILNEFMLDKVIFIPTGDPPHKAEIELAGKEHRFAMLELAVEGEPRFEVSRIEIDREGKTYTVDTLQALRGQTGAHFFFIIGADTLYELPTWRNYQEVFKLTDFICISRPGYDEKKTAEYLWFYQHNFDEKICVSSAEGLNVSSKGIRELVKKGCSIEGLTPNKVEIYITENGLYR